MEPPGIVYVSAVTSEFGEARDLVVRDLRTSQHSDVLVQEEFAPTSGTLLESIEAAIQRSSAVIALVGRRSGAFPPKQEAAPFADLLPSSLDEASYTQWEVIFALHHRRQLFLFRAADDYQPDHPPPEDDRRKVQKRFARWLFDENGLDWTVFADRKDLRIALLKTRLDSDLDGTRHDAGTAGGLEVTEVHDRGGRRRRDPIEARRLPAPKSRVVGRDTELLAVLEALASGDTQLVLLVGPDGVGKRTLLQDLTHRRSLPSFDDGSGVHPLLLGDEQLDDLCQAIWEEFYESAEPGSLSPRQRGADLQELRASIFLPDADHIVDLLPDLLEAMPESVFCASVDDAALDDTSGLGQLEAAEVVRIGGLRDPAAMLATFEAAYRSPVPQSLQDEIVGMCEATGGMPGSIELLAHDARKETRGDEDGRLLRLWAGAHRSGETVTGHVFISYSSDDRAYVDRLAEHLRERSVPAWIDKSGIDHGDAYDDVIEAAIEDCQAFVVVMTPEAKESKWVKREIYKAEDEQKTILPLLLKGKLFFVLSELQHEDVTTEQMPSERFVDELRRLTRPRERAIEGADGG